MDFNPVYQHRNVCIKELGANPFYPLGRILLGVPNQRPIRCERTSPPAPESDIETSHTFLWLSESPGLPMKEGEMFQAHSFQISPRMNQACGDLENN